VKKDVPQRERLRRLQWRRSRTRGNGSARLAHCV
jgi:hypothetical protein